MPLPRPHAPARVAPATTREEAARRAADYLATSDAGDVSVRSLTTSAAMGHAYAALAAVLPSAEEEAHRHAWEVWRAGLPTPPEDRRDALDHDMCVPGRHVCVDLA